MCFKASHLGHLLQFSSGFIYKTNTTQLISACLYAEHGFIIVQRYRDYWWWWALPGRLCSGTRSYSARESSPSETHTNSQRETLDRTSARLKAESRVRDEHNTHTPAAQETIHPRHRHRAAFTSTCFNLCVCAVFSLTLVPCINIRYLLLYISVTCFYLIFYLALLKKKLYFIFF